MQERVARALRVCVCVCDDSTRNQWFHPDVRGERRSDGARSPRAAFRLVSDVRNECVLL